MKVLLDLDTGVDDALALFYLADAQRRGQVELVGCGTVAGNVGVERTTRNTLKLMELVELAVPVAGGSGRPLAGTLHTASYVHGRDGLAETDLAPPNRRPTGVHAVDQILRLSRIHAEELVILAFGPLTNLALAFERDPQLAARLKRVVLMGGSLSGGNVTPVAEANISNDPEAARIVFASGAPITMVGLDVTRETYLEESDLTPLMELGGWRARLALHLIRYMMESYQRLGRPPQCVLHDPLSAGVCLEPDLVKTERLHVDVETRGELTRGMTVADRRPSPDSSATVDVALEVDADRFRQVFLAALVRWASRDPKIAGRRRVLAKAA